MYFASSKVHLLLVYELDLNLWTYCVPLLSPFVTLTPDSLWFEFCYWLVLFLFSTEFANRHTWIYNLQILFLMKCIWVCLYMWGQVLAEPEGGVGSSWAIVSHPMWLLGTEQGSSVSDPNYRAIFPGPGFLIQGILLFWFTFIWLFIHIGQGFLLFLSPIPFIWLGTKARKEKGS